MAKHFVLQGFVSTEAFKSPAAGGRQDRPPEQNRVAHGASLSSQLAALEASVEQSRIEAHDDDVVGLTIEFESFPNVALAFESLAREQSGIELRNVREIGEATFATVFVPDGKLGHFEKLIADYLVGRTNRRGQPIDHQKLIDTIQNIREATLRSMWTDSEPFPTSEDIHLWWEVWLPVRKERSAVLSEFMRKAEANELRVAKGELHFPERTVLLVFASPLELQRDASLLNTIAEVRRAKEAADFFDSLPVDEQREWLDELLSRVKFVGSESAPYVCILDTGVNRGHPLLAPALADTDLHSVEPGWGVTDDHGHGTNMAGLALAGDLTPWLDGNGQIIIPHRLESVKILMRDGANRGDSRHFGYLTIEAVARPEIRSPQRLRVFSLAVTTQDGRDRGRPSSWSAAIDGLAAGTDAEGDTSRLIIVAAGNSVDHRAYPDGNSTDSIHDPGQAWNALTVGAFTVLTRITEPGASRYKPLAAPGGLSPHSTTSSTWKSEWPLKPDVVFEGGNVAADDAGPLSLVSLSLLTTDHEPAQRLFTSANATSAATSLAARFAAGIRAQYPNLRPETIRGLMVHSADWTTEMKRMYAPRGLVWNKSDITRLIRHCGFGVPDAFRARESVANSLSLIVEGAVTPFERNATGTVRSKEMQLHELPWPHEELLSLGAVDVEMRVTLSYFIEPNPSARAQSSRYRYQSHGLRFDVRRPGESTREFRARINRAVVDEENSTGTGGAESGWLLGISARHRGSVHSDVWRGSAADLASRGVLAVYPAVGWWKTRTGQRRWDSSAPYSLIVSIQTPVTGVDLYAAIAGRISIEIGGDQ